MQKRYNCLSSQRAILATPHTNLATPYQILPYELLIKQAKLLFMHSIEYDYAPISFHGIWTKNFINQGERPLRIMRTITLFQTL